MADDLHAHHELGSELKAGSIVSKGLRFGTGFPTHKNAGRSIDAW